jgi:hypothetical protein
VLLTTLRVSTRRVPTRRRTAFIVAGVFSAVVIAAAVVLWPGGGTTGRPAVRVQERAPASIQPGDTRAAAVRWVATQVGRDVVVACDSAVCSALAAQGIPSGSLVVIGPSSGDILQAGVVVDTSVIRSRYGSRLAGMVAPHPLVQFGQGASGIDVREIVPDSLAAYRGRLASDLRDRRLAGRELAKNRHLTLSPLARSQLVAGQVDTRLLTALAALSNGRRLNVAGFEDGGTPAGSIPFRTVLIQSINGTVPAGKSPQVTAVLRYLNGQDAGYRPAEARITGAVLAIRYAAPSPVGLLGTHGANAAKMHGVGATKPHRAHGVRAAKTPR